MKKEKPEMEVTFINVGTPEEVMERLNKAYDILFDSMMKNGYVFAENGLLVKPPKTAD